MSLAKPESPRAPSRVLVRGERVLVVDDEPVLRQYAVRILNAEGFTVFEAADGREALMQVEARGGLLDVVVSDIVMPRLNG
ncbi:MAG TPA: response regulator, partial [Gemmatimonadales bacterium]